MRDYTKHFYTIDDTPLVQFVAYRYYWFNTPEECQAFIDSFGGSSPGGGTLSAVSPAYFRWNKNLMTIWLNSSFVQNLGPNIDQGETKQNVYIESPRQLGINSRVESKGFKTGGGKGGRVTISFATYLRYLQEEWARAQYPKRWQDALVIVISKFNAGKVTESQVTAWLISVDLTKKATVI